MSSKTYTCEFTGDDVAVIAGAVKNFSEHFQQFMTSKLESLGADVEESVRAELEAMLDESFLEISTAKMKVETVFEEVIRDVMIEKLQSGKIKFSIGEGDCGHEECK